MILTSRPERPTIVLLFLGFDGGPPSRRSELIGSLVGGVAEATWRAGADLSTCHATGTADAEPLLATLASQSRATGVLLCPVSDVVEEHLALLESREIPSVTVGRHIVGRPMSFVSVDDADAAFRATTHLLRLGHRRVGLITGAQDILPRRAHCKGYVAALRAHDVPVDDRLIWVGSPLLDEADGYAGMHSLLQEPTPPTAAFVAGDRLAAGALEALAEVGLAVPDDVAIVGWDDTGAGRAVRPPLTAISHPHYRLGRVATETLLELIACPDDVPREVFLTAPLMVRQSCGAYRSAEFADDESADPTGP